MPWFFIMFMEASFDFSNVGIDALAYSLMCARIAKSESREDDCTGLVALTKDETSPSLAFFEALLFGKTRWSDYASKVREMGINSLGDFTEVLKNADNTNKFKSYAPVLSSFFREAHDIASESCFMGSSVEQVIIQYRFYDSFKFPLEKFIS